MATYIKKDFASPNGPILLLSAKGSTTASIAQANGVKDFSGNGNHGTASGGIGVTNDSEMGSCFDFTDLSAVQSINGAFQNPSSSLTLSIRYKRTGSIAQRNQLLIGDADSSNVCRLSIYITTRTDPDLVTVAKYSNSDNDPLTCNINTTLGKTTSDVHLYTVTYDAGASLLSLYIDDTLAATKTVPVQTFTVSKFMLGYPTASYRPVGLISEARIYPRALSAAEVKYLYNGFQPNIIVGQTIPSGAILDLSARGLTTAGIAQSNGVVDRSGNGNHGQAYNGVAVVNDDEMGSCFSFDGTAVKKITFSNTYPISTNAITLAVKIRHLGRGGGSDGYNVVFGNNMVLCYSPAGSICLQLKNNSSGNAYRVDTVNNTALVDGNVHSLIGIMYIENNVCYLQTYVDGVLQSPDRTYGSSSQSTLFNGIGNMLIGELHESTSYKSNIQLSDIRIYPRALTASEVQQLADASLKKITNIKSGSSDVRQIFSNGEMIYAKTNDYSLNL